jgi:hypothetical protein
MENTLSFYPPSCAIDPGFWEELYQRKVNVYKLDDSAQRICAVLTSEGDLGLSTESFGFSDQPETHTQPFCAQGSIQNFNTIEAFKELNKKAYLQSKAAILYHHMLDPIEVTPEGHSITAAIRFPHLLHSFVLIMFADLKAYKYTYWFGMPTFVPPVPTIVSEVGGLPIGNEKIISLYRSLPSIHGFTCLSKRVFGLKRCDGSSDWEILSLEEVWPRRYDVENVVLVIVDNCMGEATSASNPYKHGWYLRNLIALLEFHCSSTETVAVNILSLRSAVIRKVTDCIQSVFTDTGSSYNRVAEYLFKISEHELGELNSIRRSHAVTYICGNS